MITSSVGLLRMAITLQRQAGRARASWGPATPRRMRRAKARPRWAARTRRWPSTATRTLRLKDLTRECVTRTSARKTRITLSAPTMWCVRMARSRHVRVCITGNEALLFSGAWCMYIHSDVAFDRPVIAFVRFMSVYPRMRGNVLGVIPRWPDFCPSETRWSDDI